MAVTKQENPNASTPSYDPDLSVDYNRMRALVLSSVSGLSKVSLTEWDNGYTAPAVMAGSILDCQGYLYTADSEETIDATGVADGDMYLVFNPTALQYEWETTEPAWDDDYNGYYVGAKRFTGHIVTYDSGDYKSKRQIMNWNQGLNATYPTEGF